MKIKVLLSAILMVIAGVAYSQFSVKFGEAIKMKRGIPEFIGSDSKGNHYIEFSEFNGDTQILVVDKNMNVVKEVEFELPKKSDRYLKDLFMEGDKMYALTASYEDKLYGVYWQEIPLSTLSGASNATKIIEVPFQKNRDVGKLSIRTSEDGSKRLIYMLHARDKEETERISVVVLNQEMDEVWSSENIDLPYVNEEFTMGESNIDNDGNVYIQGKVYAKLAKKAEKAEYEYHIIRISDRGAKVNDQEVKIEEMFINDMVFDEYQGKVRLIGLYSNKSTKKAGGLVLITLNSANGEIGTMNKVPYSQDLFSEFRTEKEQAKVDKKKAKGKEETELYEYDIRNVVYHEDGSFDVFSEQNYVYVTYQTVSNGNGGTTTRTVYNYIYNDVVASKFDANDTHLWTTAIHKSQRSQNDGGIASSYALFVDGDDNYFLYNDNVKNIGKFDPSTWKPYTPSAKTGVVVYTKLDKNGEKVKKDLFSAKESGMIAIPKLWERMDENSMMIYVGRGKKVQFGKLTKK